MAPWTPKKALDKSIYDYMVKKNMLEAAEIFAQEANIEDMTIDDNSADGLLKKWWGSLWDVYTVINPHNAETKTIATTEELLEILCSIFPGVPFGLPPSIQRTQSIDPSATSPKPVEWSNQQTVNNNEMETIAPALPRPEMSQQALCGMLLESEESVTFPVNNPENPGYDGMPQMPTIFPNMHEQEKYLKHFGIRVQINTDQVCPDQNVGFGGMSEMPTMLAKMYEQKYLRSTGRADLADEILRCEAQKMSQMLYSSQFSPQVQEEVFQLEDVLEKIEQHCISVEVQPLQQSRGVQHQLGRDGGRGVNGETSKAVLVPGEGGATLAASEEVASTGSSVSSNCSSSSSY